MSTRPSGIQLCDELQIDADALDLLEQPQRDVIPATLELAKLNAVLLERFHQPMEYPPIFQSTVPGDSVVIAIVPGTTRGSQIGLAAADLLAENGTAPGDISLLVVDSPEFEDFSSDRYHVVRFDPDDPHQRAYLIAGMDAEPVYISRVLFDADVVIPVGSFYGAAPRDSICPAFCDRPTREYLLGLPPREADATINMINENLGVFWQINVLDGPGNELVDILVGARRRVLLECVGRSGDIWKIETAADHRLVIVTLEADADQNWENAAAALLRADQVAGVEGVIALISRISTAPPAHWKRAGQALSPASRLVDLFERRHVYLFSKLTRAVAEESGFAPIADSDEFQRLLQHYGPGTLIRDAHKAELRIASSSGNARTTG